MNGGKSVLKTEMRNEKTTHIDKMDTISMLKAISDENFNAVKAVDEALPEISKAVDIISDAIAKGGRLIYIGAGTSGRLAVTDAAECPPTFGVDYNTVCAMIAGGEKTLVRAAENEEDFEDKGREDLKEKNITKDDVICGISASGGAAYVAGAMKEAKEMGCKTISISSNPDTLIGSVADVEIVTDTGAEVIQGSTRMKAGTAQKLVLNMLSTCAMIKTGKVYENVMVNLKPTNIKLRKRVINIVCSIKNIDEEKAVVALDKYNWVIRDVLENI